MPAYKVNISLPPELVAEIDAAAAAAGTSRSALIAEASTRYLAEKAADAAQERRARDIDAAITRMREIGKKIPRDFDYVAAIHHGRGGRRVW